MFNGAKKTLRPSGRKIKLLDLDITSLLDILVILLVFLLQSYNTTDLEINVPKNLDVPSSISQEFGRDATIVYVAKDGNIWIDNKEIPGANVNHSDSEGKITLLYEKLKLAMEERAKRMPATEEKKKEGIKDEEGKLVNLVMDKDLEYSKIRKVMHTSGMAGYSRFKLVVKAN